MRTTFEQKLNNLKKNTAVAESHSFTLHMAKLYGITEKALDKNAEKFGLTKVGYDAIYGANVKGIEVVYKF